MKAHLLWSFAVTALLLVDQQQRVGREGNSLDSGIGLGPPSLVISRHRPPHNTGILTS